MRASRQSPWIHSPSSAAFLFIFSLWTLAGAQSVYSMLVANPNFLGVRLSANQQLLGLVAVLNLLPPLVLFLFWLLLHLLSERLARAFLGIAAAALLLVLFWQAHNLYLGERWQSLANSYLLWLLPAGLLGVALARSPAAIRALALIAPVMLLLPANFLAKTWSAHQLFVESAQDSLRRAVARTGSSDRPAVFLLIFDELSLPVLLNKDGRIDAATYPHFAELARDSYWFRQAVANANFTNYSLPPLLTGRFPHTAVLTQRAYPNNLFRLLEPHYEVFVYETWSKFCQPDRYHCLRDSDRLEASDAALFLDVFYLLAARVVPRGSNLHPPDVRRDWGFFHNPRVAIDLSLRRTDRFMEAVTALERPANVLLFYHNSLPHSPYWVSENGEIREAEPATFRISQRGHPEEVAAVFSRYKAQVRFVDAQLGRFVDLLKRRGLFDPSLIIVTSDHGISFDPGAPGRDLVVQDGRAVNAETLLRVPLFIKRPHQQTGAVSDRDVQLIDIMPTVAEIVGVEVPWPHEGLSVFAPGAPPRNRVAYDRSRRYEFPGDPRLGWTVLQPERPQGRERVQPR